MLHQVGVVHLILDMLSSLAGLLLGAALVHISKKSSMFVSHSRICCECALVTRDTNITDNQKHLL